MGNCIGGGNEKEFLLFLFFGSLIGIILNSECICHLFYMIFMDEHNIINKMFQNYTTILIICVIVFLFSTFLISNRICNIYFTLPPAAMSLAYFDYLFYLTKNQEGVINATEINPMSILIMCGCLPLNIFVFVFFMKQIKLVSKGLTTKQFESISREMAKLNPNYTQNTLHFKERIINILLFLKKPKETSLLTYEMLVN